MLIEALEVVFRNTVHTRAQNVATKSIVEIGDAVWSAYRWKWCDVCAQGKI